MEIPLYARGMVSMTHPLLLLVFEREYIGASQVGGMACLTIQGNLGLGDQWKVPEGQASPVLLSLHGVMHDEAGNFNIGADLLPPNGLPLSLVGKQLFNLAYRLPLSYVQHLENRRATQGVGSDFTLFVRLWGTVLGAGLSNPTAKLPSIVGIETEVNGYRLRFPESDWIRHINGMGFPSKRTVDVPTLDASQMPEEVKEAIRHVNEALNLFVSNRYREAVQRCRQARDALIGTDRDRVTWCIDHLGGPLGEQKALMIDDSLKALNRLGNLASHAGRAGDQIEIDRDTAEYVIGQFTYILNYIGRKLR
jgi:hypothetical protein